jgi:hypothetical protein
LGLEGEPDALERVVKAYVSTGMDEQLLAHVPQQQELGGHLLADVARHLRRRLGAELACPTKELGELLLGKAQRHSDESRPSEGQGEHEQCGESSSH